jgi:catalase
MSRRIALIAPLLAAMALTCGTMACGISSQRQRVPSEIEEVVTNIAAHIDQERYEQIYSDSSDLWKRDVTLEQSNEVFKTLRTKLGKVENRSLNSANEQHNSGGVLKGHVFILSYETRFERGHGMETFTLIEDNGRWLLARYLVNSTDLR